VTARLKSLPTAAQAALVGAGLLLVLLIGYLALISPKRSSAASLKTQTAAVEAQILANKSTSFTQALPAVRSAGVYSLTQAMPSKVDTAGVLITLSELAKESGISFDQIAPSAGGSAEAVTTTTDPFAAEPINVQFSGSFYDLLTFLQRVRNLVRVENGKLYTAGRLFDVTTVTFAEGAKGWPQVQASLTLNEFVPNTASTTPTALGTSDTASSTGDTTSTPTDTTSTTDSTTTTTDTTATTSSDSTSAAPSTSGGTS
jgi:Tfp pilus assembly protein PilO